MPNWTKELESRLASLRLTRCAKRDHRRLSEHLELRYAELETKASTKPKH